MLNNLVLYFQLSGATPLTRAFELFGSVNNPIIPMLSCTGREPNILDCPQGNFLVPCDHTMTAGVQCYGMLIAMSCIMVENFMITYDHRRGPVL